MHLRAAVIQSIHTIHEYGTFLTNHVFKVFTVHTLNIHEYA